MEENDIIYLDDEERYLLVKKVMYEKDTYFLAVGLNDNDGLDYQKTSILKKIIEDKDTYVEEITDKEILDKLTDVFKNID